MRWLAVFLLSLSLFATRSESRAQYRFHLPDKHDYTSVYLHRAEGGNGFVANASVIVMFTTGVADRNGLRIGAGANVGYRVGDWVFATGLDLCKTKELFHLGTTYAGVQYEDQYGYGASYYLNRYYQGDKQTSAVVALLLDDFRIKFEDDILALPFTGFKIYDRFRTAALEVQFKNILIGTNVYTTDISGVTDMANANAKGVYRNGKQLSSPIYAGYATRGLIARLGWNNALGGRVIQNFTHRKLFGTPDFETGDYNNLFLQLGVNKPYTLY